MGNRFTDMNTPITVRSNWRNVWWILVLAFITSCAQTRHDLNSRAAIIAKYENSNFHRLVWSPDGKRIASVQGFSDGELVGYGNLVLLDISTGTITKLGNEKWGYASIVGWSSASNQIAVTGEGGLWLVSVADGNARYLTKGEGAAWSPDGKTLAVFRGPRSGSSQDVYQIVFVTSEGQEIHTIDTGIVGTSKPSSTLLPSGPGDQQLMPVAYSPESYLTGMDWSPDAQSIVYGIVSPNESRGDLFVINVDGSEVRKLTEMGFAEEPSWSPQANRIAYIFSLDQITPDLFVTTSQGDCHLPLTQGGYIRYPSWSPDGKKIAVLESASGALYILDVEKSLTDQYFDPKQCNQ